MCGFRHLALLLALAVIPAIAAAQRSSPATAISMRAVVAPVFHFTAAESLQAGVRVSGAGTNQIQISGQTQHGINKIQVRFAMFSNTREIMVWADAAGLGPIKVMTTQDGGEAFNFLAKQTIVSGSSPVAMVVRLSPRAGEVQGTLEIELPNALPVGLDDFELKFALRELGR